MNNKIIIMSCVVFGTMAMASCSDSEDIKMPGGKDGSISFNPYVGRATSRAAAADIKTLQASDKGFGVFANWEAGLNWEIGSKAPNFMNNQQVTFMGGQWVYSPVKYWPASPAEKVSFLAYAPYTDNAIVADKEASTVASAAYQEGKGVVVSYAMGESISKQDDFLYSTALNKTNITETIDFAFSHALAKVGFKVIGWETSDNLDASTKVTVNAISLSTQLGSGDFILDEGRWDSLSLGESTKAYVLKGDLIQNNEFTCTERMSGQLNTEDGYVFTLPAADGKFPSYCVLVDYTVETQDASLPGGKLVTRNKVYRTIAPAFEQGKAYTLNIHIGLCGSNGDKDDGGSGNPGFGNPDPVDPSPEDPTVPSKPSEVSSITFSASVNGWNNEGNGLEIPITPVVDEDKPVSRPPSHSGGGSN